MSRPFEAVFDSSASVRQIHDAFSRQDYWLDRIAAFGGAKQLRSLQVAPDGTVTSTVAEDLRHNSLNGLLAKFYRGDLEVVSIEKWHSTTDDRVEGDISVSVVGAPGSGHGAAVLTPGAKGCRLTVSGIVEFNVPLIGGRIETSVAAQFVTGLHEIQEFTTTWALAHV